MSRNLNTFNYVFDENLVYNVEDINRDKIRGALFLSEKLQFGKEIRLQRQTASVNTKHQYPASANWWRYTPDPTRGVNVFLVFFIDFSK